MKIVPERHPFPQLREADGGASLLVQGTATEQEASGDYAYVGPLGFESKKIPKAPWDYQCFPEAWQVAAAEWHLPITPEWQSSKRGKSNSPITILFLKPNCLCLKFSSATLWIMKLSAAILINSIEQTH